MNDAELWRKQASADAAEITKLRAEITSQREVSIKVAEAIDAVHAVNDDLVKERDAALLQVGELCAALERLIPIVRVLTKDSTEAADADNAEGLVMKCRRLAYDTEKQVGEPPLETCAACAGTGEVHMLRKTQEGGKP